jgi:hypothetical protein
VSRLGSAVRNVREGDRTVRHTPAPSPTSTTSSYDERIRCHLSSVTPLAFAHTKAVSIPCQLPYTRTPRTLAQYETAKSARLLVLDPNTILASRPPTAPPGATRWALLLLPISLSVCLLLRRHPVVGCALTRTVSGGGPECGGLLARTLAWRFPV